MTSGKVGTDAIIKTDASDDETETEPSFEQRLLDLHALSTKQ